MSAVWGQVASSYVRRRPQRPRGAQLELSLSHDLSWTAQQPCPHARRTSHRLRRRRRGSQTAKRRPAPSVGRNSRWYGVATTAGFAEGYSVPLARRHARPGILTGSSSPNPNVRVWIATPSCAASQWVGDQGVRRVPDRGPCRAPASSPSLSPGTSLAQTKTQMRTAL